MTAQAGRGADARARTRPDPGPVSRIGARRIVQRVVHDLSGWDRAVSSETERSAQELEALGARGGYEDLRLCGDAPLMSKVHTESSLIDMDDSCCRW